MAKTFVTSRIQTSSVNRDRYKDAFVAFIDILGFSNIIERSISDQNLTRDLYKALREAPTSSPLIGPPNYPPGLTYVDFVSTNFSDSIVISSEKSPHGLMTVIEIGRAFASILLQFGLLTRGGVAAGQIIHDDNVIFGPGLVNAYMLESKDAKFARIILSEECREIAKIEVLSQGETAAYFSSTLRTDRDGKQFVHVLREMEESSSRSEDDKILKLWWGKAKNTINDYLTQSAGEPFRDKIEWFASYYNSCISHVSSPDEADWRAPIRFDDR